jgi:hypothetical protein
MNTAFGKVDPSGRLAVQHAMLAMQLEVLKGVLGVRYVRTHFPRINDGRLRCEVLDEAHDAAARIHVWWDHDNSLRTEITVIPG